MPTDRCSAAANEANDGASYDRDVGLLSEKQIHELTHKAFQVGNEGRLQFVELLGIIHDDRIYCGLGYSSFAQYCELEFRLGRSTAFDYLRVAQALPALPRTRVLFAQGDLSWNQVRGISRVASAQSEEEWVRLALTESVRKLETEVRQAVRTGRDRPRANRYGLPNLTERVSFDLTLEYRERLMKVLHLIADGVEGADGADGADRSGGAHGVGAVDRSVGPRAAGGDSEGDRSVGAHAADERGGVSGVASGKDGASRKVGARARSAGGGGKGPAEDRRTVLERFVDRVLAGAIPLSERAVSPKPWQTIVYHSCPDCGRAAVDSDAEGRIEIDAERIEELAPVADWVEIPRGEEYTVAILPVGEIDKPNSAALARKVLFRDGARCANPGCNRRRNLHAHHIEFRSKGGRTVLGNLIAVCDICHALLHSGRLEVTGSPTAGVTWIRRPVDPTTRLREVASVEAKLAELNEVVARHVTRDRGAAVEPAPAESGRVVAVPSSGPFPAASVSVPAAAVSVQPVPAAAVSVQPAPAAAPSAQAVSVAVPSNRAVPLASVSVQAVPAAAVSVQAVSARAVPSAAVSAQAVPVAPVAARAAPVAAPSARSLSTGPLPPTAKTAADLSDDLVEPAPAETRETTNLRTPLSDSAAVGTAVRARSQSIPVDSKSPVHSDSMSPGGSAVDVSGSFPVDSVVSARSEVLAAGGPAVGDPESISVDSEATDSCTRSSTLRASWWEPVRGHGGPPTRPRTTRPGSS
jgi:hypothetical protein